MKNRNSLGFTNPNSKIQEGWIFSAFNLNIICLFLKCHVIGRKTLFRWSSGNARTGEWFHSSPSRDEIFLLPPKHRSYVYEKLHEWSRFPEEVR